MNLPGCVHVPYPSLASFPSIHVSSPPLLQTRSGSAVPCIFNQMRTDEKPPTYFRTSVFTGSFQAIVDAYGVASYREVNPSELWCALYRICSACTHVHLYTCTFIVKEVQVYMCHPSFPHCSLHWSSLPVPGRCMHCVKRVVIH